MHILDTIDTWQEGLDFQCQRSRLITGSRQKRVVGRMSCDKPLRSPAPEGDATDFALPETPSRQVPEARAVASSIRRPDAHNLLRAGTEFEHQFQRA